MGEPPTDWVSGERVFAPPTGTLDVDWLVPAVLDALPGTAPTAARAALERARARLHAAPDTPELHDELELTADAVVREAAEAFRT
ncbi:hypothetical protein [Aquipuribacter nitratireducens]|uniref:Uncharacterized protein n=1 Tax=Aquipuribacter nitratireducens TaxID=650104 RepID=A0ABW0GM11_9MICO